MPVVLARWPNATFSVVLMPKGFSMVDLYWTLDEEADPQFAVAYLLGSKNGESAHATFDWNEGDFLESHQDGIQAVRLGPASGTLDSHSGRLKELKWPRGIVRLAYRSLSRSAPVDKPQTIREMSSDEIASFPAEPCETFSVAEVRKMPPFCGVYLAYNEDGSCHYVGESKNVTSRVVRSREEIGDRRIGVVRCELHDRKRIEAYFTAMLDPPGNGISTHRMKSSLVSE
jgi:hypothetical protein